MRLKAGLAVIVFILGVSAVCLAGETVQEQSAFYFDEGVTAQRAMKFAEAEVAYAKTLMVDPYNKKWKVLIANNRGIMSVQNGDMSAAEEQFKLALQMDPKYMPARVNLGFIYDKKLSKLESLQYWLDLLGIDVEKAKPQGYVISLDHKENR